MNKASEQRLKQCSCGCWVTRTEFFCPKCGQYHTESLPGETSAPLSEADEVQIGRSQAELAVLKKDGRSYEIRRIAGQALEVITRLNAARETTAHTELLKKLPLVDADFVAEVQTLPRQELERRVLIQKDWLGSYSRCLDGLGLKIGVESARDPRDIRRLVESMRPEEPSPPQAWGR